MWFVALGGSFTIDKLIGEMFSKDKHTLMLLLQRAPLLSIEVLCFEALPPIVFSIGSETLSTTTARKIANSIATQKYYRGNLKNTNLYKINIGKKKKKIFPRYPQNHRCSNTLRYLNRKLETSA